MKLKNLLISIAPPAFIVAFRFLTRNINYLIFKRNIKGLSRLHLTCGNNILEGWVNVDYSNKRNVVVWDLTDIPLPVADCSINYIFLEHFIEHINVSDAEALLKDCCRVLTRGGVIRISTPNLRKLISEYELGSTGEWLDVGWKPNTPCQMINEGFRLWGHQYIYDIEELHEMLNRSGFNAIKEVKWRESEVVALKDLECRPFHGEIIVEASKAK